MKIFGRTKGAVSIFLVIILVPMMTVSALFVDASKVKLARGTAESAGDLALNTALTDYDTKLKDLYGLFATAQDTSELYEKLEDYYRTCITSSGVSEEDASSYTDMIMSQLGLVASDNDTADILNMNLVDFSVSKMPDANLTNASIIEKQIVDFMKYRAPINTGLSFISSIKSFSTLSKQTELVDKRQEYYEEQETVMQNAQEAWKYIYRYNQSGFIKSDNYFPDMESKFSTYEGAYYDIAKKIIKDLYDAQSYGTFNAKTYSIVGEEVEVDGKKEIIPTFYTNSDKTSKLTPYNELTTFSNSNKASANDIRLALNEYYTSYNIVKTAQSQLMEYNNNTYGQQYLIQTNRRGLYNTWVQGMVKLYEKYSALCHAVKFAEEGAMNTSEKMMGSSVAQTYNYYYSQCNGDWNAKYDINSLAAVFNQELSDLNSTLDTYENNTNTSTSGVEGTIADLFGEVTGYRKTISDAKTNLEAATKYLSYVYDGIKDGGTLEQKQKEWKSTAGSSDLKNTSMAKQDLAEIDSLSTYLNPTDVQKLIGRLNNIITNLGNMLDEIDSYTFFGTKIVEISDYSTMVHILENNIGANNLKRVPTDNTELDNQINAWCNGKFVIGKKVDTSWRNQSGTQAKLSGTGTDKLNFYSFLYQHFNAASEAASDGEDMKEDTSNGKDFYNGIKNKAESDASSTAEGTDGGSISTSTELNSLANRPSLKSGSDAATASAEVKTGDSAAKDTSSSLSSMFSSLSAAAVSMGTDLRDKLYVSDYILNMFSYDTIEKEYAVKHPGEKAKIQTLTLVDINADNNAAYGKEVEYIIFGGSNSSNLTKAYGSIYGIRLGFNLIYAFMDSSIRDTAFAIATPISAATLGVVPVPLIQAAIIIGIACCESALDLSDLRAGKSVPLFKDKETWTCSISGLVGKVKSEVGSALKEVTTSAVDIGSGKLQELLDMTDEQLTGYIEGGTDDLIDSVSASYDTLIANHVNTAVQKLTTLCNNAIEEAKANTDMKIEEQIEYVENGLNKWIESEKMSSDTSSIAFTAKEEAVRIIKEKYISSMINALDEAGNAVNDTVASLANKVTGVVDRVRAEITQTIIKGSDKIIEYKNKMIEKVNSSIENGASNLKSTLNEQIDGVFGSGGGSSTDNTGLASLLSFYYSDYLRLFLMIGLYTNEEGILLRTGDAIQANMIKQTGETGFLLENSAVYVQISSTVQVKPTLLPLPLFADVDGNPSTNEKWYTIKYESVRGY